MQNTRIQEEKQKLLYQCKNLILQLKPFQQRKLQEMTEKDPSPAMFLTPTHGKYIEKRKISGQ